MSTMAEVRQRRKSADNHGPRDPDLVALFQKEGSFDTKTLLEYEKQQETVKSQGKATKLERDAVIKARKQRFSTWTRGVDAARRAPQDALPIALEKRFLRIRPRRSVDLLLRTRQQFITNFVVMAEKKANLLITMSLFVFSISLSLMAEGRISFTLITFSIFVILSLAFAVHSVLPVYFVPQRRQMNRYLGLGSFNLLRMSNYVRIPMDVYMRFMGNMTKDQPMFYRHLCRDIYLSGVHLQIKKARWLRLAYLAFTSGAFIALLVYVFTSLLGLELSSGPSTATGTNSTALNGTLAYQQTNNIVYLAP